MNVKIKQNLQVLLVYKRSPLVSIKGLPIRSTAINRFKANHLNHYASLRTVESILRKHHIVFHKRARSRSINYRSYDLVITVGGDGTFLEAARQSGKNQFILGVNSDPAWSVGQFCACDAVGFEKVLTLIMAKKARYTKVYKIRVLLSGHKPVDGMNDLLICHANPAAMSRYKVQIGPISEEHRSSGVWLSTAAGSTGAILSAGGRHLPLKSRHIQYRPRELYSTARSHYRLKGGLVGPSLRSVFISQMSSGRIFIDGAHNVLPFEYGKKAVISSSPNYIKLIHA